MNPTDTAEIPVKGNEPESKVLEGNASKEEPRGIFKSLKERAFGSSRNIFKAFSTVREEHPTVDLSAEQNELDALSSQLQQETEKAEVSLLTQVEDGQPQNERGIGLNLDEERKRLRQLGATATAEDWDALYAAEEAEEKRLKNEEDEKKELGKIKYKIDELLIDILHDKTDNLEVCDWVAEKPDRTSEALKYIISQEEIVDKIMSISGLNSQEKENIEKTNNAIEAIRIEFEKRGIDIPSRVAVQNETKVQDETGGEPIDPSSMYEYAYHASPFRNLPSIAEVGLALSGEDSKEPGTIWFNDHDNAVTYLNDGGILYRTQIKNIPEFTGYIPVRGRPDFHGVDSTRTPISAENLEYTLDKGKTWRKDMSIFKNHNNVSQLAA